MITSAQALFAVLACTALAAQAEDFPRLRLVGDETIAAKVKANPSDYLGQPLVMTGFIEVSDLYIAKYVNAEATHYSLAFRQVLPGRSQELGERITVFLRRDETARRIVERIINQGNPAGSLTPLRIKATLDPVKYRSGSWDLMELIDVQFPAPDLKDWGPWVVETERQEKARQKATAPVD